MALYLRESSIESDLVVYVLYHFSREAPDVGDMEKKLKRKKVVKAKRRHTTVSHCTKHYNALTQ